jgi:hypothetical protein
MCLTRALAHGSLHADSCLDPQGDRAAFGGHLYSDKAPGLSVLAVPVAEAVRLGPPSSWGRSDLRLWLVRLSTGGIALLVCAFLLGRVSEGLAPGRGGAVLVTFAAGTLAATLAVDNFEEVPVAALGLAVFLLAWSRRPGWAGLVAGLSLVVGYQTAAIAALIALYVLLSGWRPLARYLGAVIPGVVLLGTYDRLAFGSPLHLSYRYVSQTFASRQAGGFFGVGAPSWHAARLVFVGNRGLLLVAPVLVLAAAGLVLLFRQGYVAEVVVAAAVAAVFLLLDVGYFDPYGGDSPGPRFFVPALPFLALGLGPAFTRRPRLTTVAAIASVVASVALLLTWPAEVNATHVYRWSVWGDLAGFVAHGSGSTLAQSFEPTLFGRAGIGRIGGATIVLLAALTAVAVALRKPERS